MKRIFISVCLVFAVLTLASGQTPADQQQQQQLLALIKEVQAQQSQIADNETKIEAKLAELGETIRVARLFAGKAGK